MTYQAFFQRVTYVLTTILIVVGITMVQSCKDKKGCTDPDAINYDSDAEEDDGSCKYGDKATDTLNSNVTSAKTISSNTFVCGDINVKDDLTIEPGVTITLCNGAGIYIKKDGSMNAEGTSSEPIVFTGSTETKGWWDDISYQSNNPNNALNHVEIKYAGSGDTWDDRFSSLILNNNNNGQLEVKNTTISHSKGFGMWIQGGANVAGFSSNTFKDNGDAGLRLGSINLIGNLDAASTYSQNNAEDYIHVDGGEVTEEQTWPNASTPYYLGEHSIKAGVTIEPGADIIFSSGGGLRVKNGAYLKAEGTSSQSITFNGETKTPGFWDEIAYNSNHPNNSLAYVTIKNGGSSDSWDNYSNLTLKGSDGNETLSLNNATIADGAGWGLLVEDGATLSVNGSQVSSASEVKSNNNFHGNGDEQPGSCTSPCDVSIN